jgi:hypothetical protein
VLGGLVFVVIPNGSARLPTLTPLLIQLGLGHFAKRHVRPLQVVTTALMQSPLNVSALFLFGHAASDFSGGLGVGFINLRRHAMALASELKV